jgi:hypothetical protein
VELDVLPLRIAGGEEDDRQRRLAAPLGELERGRGQLARLAGGEVDRRAGDVGDAADGGERGAKNVLIRLHVLVGTSDDQRFLVLHELAHALHRRVELDGYVKPLRGLALDVLHVVVRLPPERRDLRRSRDRHHARRAALEQVRRAVRRLRPAHQRPPPHRERGQEVEDRLVRVIEVVLHHRRHDSAWDAVREAVQLVRDAFQKLVGAAHAAGARIILRGR